MFYKGSAYWNIICGKMRDNRVKVEIEDKIYAKGFIVLLVCTILNIIIKISVISHYVEDFLVEICTIFTSGIYILYLRSKNEKISNKNLKEDFVICLLVILLGEFIYFFLTKNILISCLYLPVWILPIIFCDCYSIVIKLKRKWN